MLLVCDTEVDPDAYGYLPRALRGLLPEHERYHYPTEGGAPSLDGVEAVVVTGSTAGVYEADERPWIGEAKGFVRRLVDREVPTLGVCFGHQLVNDALEGRVEHRGLTSRLVEADLADHPLFAGVSPTLPMVHGDHVVRAGEGMEPIASADYYPLLATRHVDAPVWTTQYHPEFTADLLPRVEGDFDWHGSRDFDDVTCERTVANFLRLAGVR
ncbi:type 1 glutamine amidotransferase [Salinigranum sp. GCM10025319]|uniref:type 1 glutamine amidotransferase n=1 Tax=Salinigranum sp. GCM10025319 TaxID=3252687 RepID=UPI00360FE6CD